MRRALLIVGFGVWLIGCSGKSTDGGVVDGVGGFIEAGGKGSDEAGSVGEGGASNAGGASSAGSAGIVTSGEACAPEGARASNGCADCNCSNGQWVCGHRVCQQICGGISGRTCSAQDYCAYQVGDSCGAADASATCVARPGACDDIYSPVCGCDFKTYSSQCDAALHGTGVLSTGVCPTGK